MAGILGIIPFVGIMLLSVLVDPALAGFAPIPVGDVVLLIERPADRRRAASTPTDMSTPAAPGDQPA